MVLGICSGHVVHNPVLNERQCLILLGHCGTSQFPLPLLFCHLALGTESALIGHAVVSTSFAPLVMLQ